MKFSTNIAYFVYEGRLYIHVDILEFFPEPETSCFYSSCYFFQPFYYLFRICSCDDALFAEHLCMCNTSLNIVSPETMIKGYGFCEGLYNLRGFFLKPSCPQFFHMG